VTSGDPSDKPDAPARGSLANLFLIGARGSGKSTVGRLLAGRLGWTFADADLILEVKTGRSVRALFDDDGEAGFRDLESTLLAELCQGARQVVATGGGVVLRPGNRALLRAAGRVIWLSDTADVLRSRLVIDPKTDQRPALTLAGANSLTEIEQVLQLRRPLYAACADLTITTAGKTPETVMWEILAFLKDVG
jgi:shikimate kinase